jgi:hypothetical protein
VSGGTEKGLEPMPPHALRDYALLADGERGAVVGPRGEIVWMCTPLAFVYALTFECAARLGSPWKPE